MPVCRIKATQKFIADLAVRWPGMRHMFALDANQAAEYVEFATLALALQPYKAQVSFSHHRKLVTVSNRLQYVTDRQAYTAISPIWTVQSSSMLRSTD